MGRIDSTETTLLLAHKAPSAPLKFPLGLAPVHIRPYLELIRLEKVSQRITMPSFMLTISLS